MHPVWWIIGFGLIIRVAAAFFVNAWLPEGLFPDRFTYADAAADVLGGRLISSDLVMPLYPLLVALFGGTEVGQVALSVAFGTLSIGAMYLLGSVIYERRQAGLIAAALWALYPPAIFYSAIGLTEIVFTTLLLGLLWSAYSERWWLTAILVVAAILVRPAIEVLAIPLVVWFAVVVTRGGWRTAVRAVMALLVAYLVLMAPWWAHQHAKYDQFVRLNLGGGVVLYSGNNPLNTSGGGIGGVDVDFSEFADIDDPVERDRALTEAAIDYIREDPARFVSATAVKVWRFWRPLPYAPELQSSAYILGSLLIVPLVVGAITGIVLKRRAFWRLSPLLIVIAYLTAVHAVTIGSIRYRFPLEPLLILLSVPALLTLLDRYGGSSRRGQHAVPGATTPEAS